EDARRVCEEILTKYRMPGPQTEGTRDDRIETIWAGEAMRQLRSLKPPERPKPAPGAASLPAPPAGPGAPPMIAAPTAPIPAAAPTAGAMSPAGAPTPKKPKLRPLISILPLPGVIRMRATEVFRRPVAINSCA